jgi:surface protein
MSFKNFLDLRKKTREHTQIVERVVFQSRSLKSDLFLAFSVILVASAIIWGISMADYSPQTNADGTQTSADGVQNANSETSTIPNVASVIEAITETNENTGMDSLLQGNDNTVPSVVPDPIGNPSSVLSSSGTPGVSSEEFSSARTEADAPSRDQEIFQQKNILDPSAESLNSNTNLDPRIREDDIINENDTTNGDVLTDIVVTDVATDTTTIPVATQQTLAEQDLDGQATTSTTPNILENIVETVTDTSNQIKDSINNVIDKVTDIIVGTSTPKITEESLSTIEVTEQDTDTGKLVTISSPDENNCEKLLEKENFLSSISPKSTSGLTNTVANVFSSLNNLLSLDLNQEASQEASSTIESITDFPLVISSEQISDELTSTSTSSENESSTSSVPVAEKSEYEQCLQKEVHLTNVLASTVIPEVYKVGEENKIHIKWKNNGDQPMQFNAYDTDLNGYLDYVEWTVPHLSTQVFEIIFISKAFQLDQDKNIISDIYDTVKEQDGNFATINDGQYVRVTFEEVLDNTKDITIFAKLSQTNADLTLTNADGNSPSVTSDTSVIPVQTGIHAELSDWIPASAGMTDVGENDNAGAPSTNYSLPTTHSIEVYPLYTDADGNKTEGPKLDLLNDGTNPDFSNISQDTKYRILLSNLETPTDEFDLKVVSTNYSLQTTNSIDIDYIVDPELTDFVSTWDTTATSTGSSNNNQVKLPLYNGGTYNFVVDWGDSSTSTITTWNQAETTHTYSATGTYTISISGTLTGWQFNNTGDRLKIKTITQWGILRLGNVTGHFYGTANLKITATDILNMTGTTDMTSSFRDSGIDTVPSMNSWDMSNVTNMTSMFSAATNFNQNIGSWNTASVMNMYAVFFNATAFNQNIGSWNTGSVTNMSYMFYGTSAFNQNIGSWNTASTTNMSNMFKSATAFNNAGTSTINNWNTSNVTNMASMFYGATAFNQNIGSWNTGKVTDLNQMFRGATIFNQNIGGWNTASTTNMNGLFFGATAFNNGGSNTINNWNTANVTNMGAIFQSAPAFNQPIGGWNTAKVTNMTTMFNGATIFNQNIGSWITASTTDMSSMFYSASAFNNGGSNTINNWDTSKVTNMSGMFRAAAFNQNIGSWNVANVTDMNRMFQSANAFNQNIGSWNTAKVTDMTSMFAYIPFFNQNIGSWNTGKVTSMNNMFNSATAFNNGGSDTINNWNTASTTNMVSMFQSATAFNQNIGSWNVTNVTNMTSMFNLMTLSTTNYSNTLVGWSAQALKSGVTFHGGSSKYYTGAPTTARGVLTGTYGWTITADGGTQAPGTFGDTTNGNWSAGATWGNVSNVEGVGYPGPYDTAVINSNTVTLSGAQSVSTTTLSATGILNLAGFNFTSPSFTSSGTLQLTGDTASITTPTLSAGAVVEYTATSGTRDIKNWDYTNATLKINGSGGTFTLPTNLVVAGINILAGILDSNTFNITNSGNWANSLGVSGFTAGSGTVTFNGAGSTVTGATNFYRTNGSGSILAFPSLSTIMENNTVIGTNNGVIAINNATTTTNSSTGVINTNNSGVTTNNGIVTTNSSLGTVSTNNATTTTNNGMVTSNALAGTVVTNNLTVTTNNGTVTNNNGTVSNNAFGGSITNNLGSIGLNNGTTDTATFNDGEFNGGTGIITGDAIFNYSGFVAVLGSIVDITGYANGIVFGTSTDSLSNTILTWVFNTTDNLGTVTGDAVFNGTSTNTGTVDGNVIFNGTSTNSGTIMHNVDIYAPVPRPIGGTIYGLKTYHDYDGMYFNDTALGHGVVGKWDDADNWWTNSAFTIHAGDFPGAGDEVNIYSDITTTTATATAASIIFEGGAKNRISINISGDVIFNATSTNALDGTITASTTTFMENLTENIGTVTGILIRKFKVAVDVGFRNFTTDNWIIIAQGVAVNISNAIYDTAVNIFKGLSGGTFTTGSNPAVTPTIISTLPTLNEIVIKWLPVVAWDTATSTGLGSCKYSYDNWTTTNTADCALGGRDIARPIAGENILSIRGTDTLGNITEQNIRFTYDNESAVWTSCGTDLLDETTREYYYLQGGDVEADCHFRVSTELRGNSSGVGTLTGNVISDATSTNAFNITLKNITVTGTTSAMTEASGKDGGNITVENSTVGTLISDGAIGTIGGRAGNITVATSSTGIITANGGSGTSQGSNGGTITVWNSDGLLASTLVESVGGSATECGSGGEGGDIQITNSNNYTAISDSGLDQIEAGEGKCAVPGTPSSHIRKTPIVSTRPVSSTVSTNTNTNTNSGTRSFNPNTINQITLPVQFLKPINLTKLPTFGEDKKGSFSFRMPIERFLFSLQDFVFTPAETKMAASKAFPELYRYITVTLGLNTTQKLANLYNKPLKLNSNATDVLGIYKVVSPKGNTLVTSFSVDKKGNLGQYIRIKDYETLKISLLGTSKNVVTGKLAFVIPAPVSTGINSGGIQSVKSENYTFTNPGLAGNAKNITTTINIPQKAGTYTFTTSASPLPLVIEVVGVTNTNITDTDTTPSWWTKVLNFFSW